MTRTLPPVLDRSLSAHESDPTSRSASHLADAPFRFGPDAPQVAAPRPTGPGADWSLAETLCELRLRNAQVAVSTVGLRVRHAHRMPEVAAAVQAHAAPVRLWLDLGRPAPEAGWDDETALRASWLRTQFGTPAEPTMLRPGVTVSNWPRFASGLESALSKGPTGPLADSARRDLGDLFTRYALAEARPPVRRRRALAA